MADGDNDSKNAKSIPTTDITIPRERLESQVSTDVAPLTHLFLNEDVPASDSSTDDHHLGTTQTGLHGKDHHVDVAQHPLRTSINDPQLNQAHCNPNTSDVGKPSVSQSCIDLLKQEIKDNVDKDEDYINVDFYDVMILYAEEDRKEASAFRDHLQRDIKLTNGESIKAVLYDGPELLSLSGMVFDHLGKAYGRCEYTFIYLTKNLVKDFKCKLECESVLMQMIHQKSWQVVPVYTKRKDERDFDIPMGLNALKGVPYYANDNYYRAYVSRLIDNKILQRKEKNNFLSSIREKVRAQRGENGDIASKLNKLSLSQEDSPRKVTKINERRPNSHLNDGNAPKQDHCLNHMKLDGALITVAADGLRQILLTNVPKDYQDFYDLLTNKKSELKGRLSLRQEQIDKLFPDPKYPKSPASVDYYDITLLYTLIRNLSSVPEPATKWGYPTIDKPIRDKSTGASTERIRDLRNKIIHSAALSVDDAKFELHWNEICNIMDDIEADIGDKGYQKALTEIKKWVFSRSEA